MTQELQKRNEILKIEQIKNYMLTQFPEEDQIVPPLELDSTFKEEDVEEYQSPINLETISTENISMKADHSTGSLIASAISSQPQADLPMIADFPISVKFTPLPLASIVEPKSCKVQFDLTKKPVLRSSEVQDLSPEPIKHLSKKSQKPPPNKLIISKDDLMKLPEKNKPSNPRITETTASLTRSLSGGEETNHKVGIFEQRKKMFEKSEALSSVKKSRTSRSPRSNNPIEKPLF